MNKTNALMMDWLKRNNYDIEFDNSRMAIVKHTDDPWNHVNKYMAKPDGVYNFIEVQMGGYQEKKRVSCSDFETACFLTLSFFISRDHLPLHEPLFLEMKQHKETIVNNSSDYWHGKFIIDEFVSLIK